MSKTDAIFVGVMVYAFVAVAFLWIIGARAGFGSFCLVAFFGLPLPFLIDRAWESFR